MDDDISNMLNEAANDSQTGLNDMLNQAANETFSAKNKDIIDLSDVLEDVAEEVLEKQKPVVDFSNKKATLTILKEANLQISNEGMKDASDALNIASSTVENQFRKDLLLPERSSSPENKDFDDGNYSDDVDALVDQDKYSDDADALINDVDNIVNNENVTKKDAAESITDSESDPDDPDEVVGSGNFEFGEDLRHACYQGNLSAVEKLLDNGTSIYCLDRHGWTCLHWAVSKGYDDIAETILRSANQPRKIANLPDKITGWTPLHVACIEGHKNCVRILLKFQAKANKKNLFGEIPADCITVSPNTVEGRSIRRLLGVMVEDNKNKK